MPKMIFHLTQTLFIKYKSGSTLRLLKMFKVFKEIGYEVYLIEGNANQRKYYINCIKRKIEVGEKIDFLYSESANITMALSEVKHWPIHPFFDFVFFNYLKKFKIPIVLFYRDLYWAFGTFKEQVELWKRLIEIPLFYYDLYRYKSIVDAFFVPSTEIIKYLPIKIKSSKIYKLPPGFSKNKDLPNKKNKLNDPLTFLYIGNILLPNYGISPIFEMAILAKNLPILILINCYLENFKESIAFYKSLGYDIENIKNVKFLHLWDKEISIFVNRADIMLILRKKSQHMEISMPIKLFDAIKLELPIITNKETVAGILLKKIILVGK